MLCTKEEKELQKSSIKKRLNTAKLQSINYITGKKKLCIKLCKRIISQTLLEA
jgi:hypothetical protein